MTNKHFVALAAALKGVKPVNTHQSNPAFLQWMMDCDQIANVCRHYTAFDRGRFLIACNQK